MKQYKLINRTTQQEHICSKIEIDGFDYYVSDEEIINQNYVNKYILDTDGKIVLLTNDHDVSNDDKEVIATNNPNIDLFQVIDEVEELAIIAYPKDLHAWGINQFDDFNEKDRNVWKEGFNKSQETQSFNKKDIFNVIEWMQTPAYLIGINDKGTIKTTKELFELWKEQQIKILYYE